MSERIVISTNLPQDETSSLPSPEQIASLNDETFVHGGRYATLIHPGHTALYRDGIAFIIRGLVDKATEDTPLPDGGVAHASIFGFRDVEAGIQPVPARLLIPSMARAFLPLFEGGYDDALHGYHARLIAETNAILGIVGSPYMLEPLSLEQ